MPASINGIPYVLGDDPARDYPSTSKGLAEWIDGNTVRPTDPRLTNARPPTSHSHTITQVTGLAAALDGKVDDDDSRLTDSRTPTAHQHELADVDGLAAALDGKVDDDDARLTDARTPTSHQHAVADVTGLAARLAALEYDSGWRALCRWAGGQVTEGTPPAGIGPRGNNAGGVFVRRQSTTVTVAVVEASVTTSSPTITLPSGFRGWMGVPYPAPPIYYRDANLKAVLANAEFGLGFVRYRDVPAGATLSTAGYGGYGVMVTVPSETALPTTLPGTPA